MTYLNCPRCRLSIFERRNGPPVAWCPRCLAALGDVEPLFATSLPARLLDAPVEEAARFRPRQRARPDSARGPVTPPA